MVFVVIVCLIFAVMYMAKLFVDKGVQGIECPEYFPEGGSNFKAKERVNANVRRFK